MNPVRGFFLRKLPAGLLARPGEWFLAVLCVLSGLTIVTGAGEVRSTAALLDPIVYFVWGASLLLGGFGMVCGLSSIRFLADGRHAVTRIACYRLGLRLLGLSATMYGIAIVIVGGWNGVLAASLTFAFAGMCGVRLLTVGTPT